MPITNLGQVRDKITSIDLTGTSGKNKTYTIKTECSPNGAGTFTVTDGTDGTNGANGYRIALSNLVAGGNLLSLINSIGIKNVLAILGKTSGSSTTPTYNQYTWSATLSNNPNAEGNVNALDITLFNGVGQSIPASAMGGYEFIVVHVDEGDVPSTGGYDLGSSSDLDGLMGAAYDLYTSNGVANFYDMAKIYPMAYGTEESGYSPQICNVFPLLMRTTGSTTIEFTLLTGERVATASTSDAGATWSYQYNQDGANLGDASTFNQAITRAAAVYSNDDTGIDLHPYAYAKVNGVPAYFFPNVDGGNSVTAFKVIYDGKDYTAKLVNGAWELLGFVNSYDLGSFSTETLLFDALRDSGIYSGAGVGKDIVVTGYTATQSMQRTYYSFKYVYSEGGNEWMVRFEAGGSVGFIYFTRQVGSSTITYTVKKDDKIVYLGSFNSDALALNAIGDAMTSVGADNTMLSFVSGGAKAYTLSYVSYSSTYKVVVYAKGNSIYQAGWDGTSWTITNLVSELNKKLTKGDYDGTTGVGYADVASNLETDIGSTQKYKLFSGESSPLNIVPDEDSFVKIESIVGASLIKNQLVRNPTFTSSSNWQGQGNANISIQENSLTCAALSHGSGFVQTFLPNIKAGDYCLIHFRYASNFSWTVALGSVTATVPSSTTLTDFMVIVQAASSSANNLTFSSNKNSASNITVQRCTVKNITLRYGNSDSIVSTIIGTDTSTQVSRLLAFDPSVLDLVSYTTPQFEFSGPNAFISINANLWNEQWEVGTYNGTTGEPQDDANCIRSKSTDYIMVNGNSEYFIKCPATANFTIFFYDANKAFINSSYPKGNETFTTPLNCQFIRFRSSYSYGTTYNNDICINFSNASFNGRYVPHKENRYPLSSGSNVDALKAFLRVWLTTVYAYGDERVGNSLITRVGTKNLSELTFTQIQVSNSAYGWQCTDLDVKYVQSAAVLGNVMSTLYKNVAYERLNYVTSDTNLISVGLNKLVIVTDGQSGGTRPSGTIYYELAEPVTSERPDLPINVKAYENGTFEMEYNNNNAPSSVTALFKANVKGFVENVASREDINWNPNNIASLVQLNSKVEEVVENIRNGNIIPALADNLVATKGLTVNDDPMSFGIVGGAQKSAVGDGNATLNKLVCVDVVRNQLVKNGDFDGQAQWGFETGVTGSVSDHVMSFTSSVATSGIYQLYSANMIGHKLLLRLDIKSTETTALANIFGATSQIISGLTTSWQTIYKLASPTYASSRFGIYCSTANNTIDVRRVNVFDLTQRYGSNEVVNAIIGTTESEQVARLLAYDPEILSDTDYDEGTLVPSKTAKLVSKDEDDNVIGTVTLPNYEGHGILKVVDGKVVADGDEVYPDGNSKKRYGIVDLGTLYWEYSTYQGTSYFKSSTVLQFKTGTNTICSKFENYKGQNQSVTGLEDKTYIITQYSIFLRDSSYTDATTFKSAMSGVYLVYKLADEEDITTPVFQSIFPVEHGGTLQFLDEDDNPIAGLQGNEIFYQKNIKAFVEAFGEAIDWNPARIERLANLSFTPEYVDITLDPSPTGAYARAQVYNATFTIVISAALTGTPNGSITFQDSEVDLTNFQTKPADAIYDMDGKKVSEAPTTADCNIASFVGRSKSGTVMWSLLHSGVNKVKIHIEEAVPLDSSGNGKIDCRASLIL